MNQGTAKWDWWRNTRKRPYLFMQPLCKSQ